METPNSLVIIDELNWTRCGVCQTTKKGVALQCRHMFVHASDAADNRYEKITIRTVDSDVIVIAIPPALS